MIAIDNSPFTLPTAATVNMALGRKRKQSLHGTLAVVNKGKRAVIEEQIDRMVPSFFVFRVFASGLGSQRKEKKQVEKWFGRWHVRP